MMHLQPFPIFGQIPTNASGETEVVVTQVPAVWAIASLATLLFFIAVSWRIYAKAGKPGWACLIPFYNLVVLLEIAGRPVWWLFLLLIPPIGVVFLLLVLIDLAKSFGKGPAFGFGLFFLPPVFSAMLAFSDAQYHGPDRVA